MCDGEHRHRALLEVLNAEDNDRVFSAVEIRQSQKKVEYTTSSTVGGALISLET